MALTIVQQPADFVPINSRALITLTSTNTSEPKFRFKVTLKSGATVISTAYIDPDPNDFGLFDCSPRLQGRVTAQVNNGYTNPTSRKTIYGLGAGKTFVLVDGNHEEITAVVDESYAATVDDEPTDQGIDDTFTFTIYPGTTLVGEGVNVNTSRGIMDGVAKECLVEVSEIDSSGYRIVRLDNLDYFSLAWFNDNEDSVEVVKWVYLITMDDGSQAVDDLFVTSSTFETGGGDGTMVYFMCGPQDLQDFTGIAAADRPSSSNDWNNYLIQPNDGATGIGNGYRIINNKRSCQYDHYQLAFTNKWGAWNYQSFYQKSNKKIEATGGSRDYQLCSQHKRKV
jgi:hypothetical protein